MINRRRIVLIAGILALLLMGWVGWSAFRTVVEARSALAALDRIQAAADNPSMEALDAVATDMAAFETHLLATRRAAGPFLLIAPAFGWLPKAGPLVEAAPPLLDMAVEVAAGGRQAVTALQPALAGLKEEGSGDGLGQVVSALQAARPELAAAGVRFANAEMLRAAVKNPLPGRFQDQLDRLDRILPLARVTLQGAQVAPALLGADEPRSYLILAQNNDEMRATGGFISAAGVVRFENGRIADLKLADSYAADNLAQPHPLPPRPLSEWMGAEMLMLRDSNWSPDFPTSAEVARALYAQDQGVFTDGVIALDMEAVRLLVEALGPLNVPGFEGPVTADNVLDNMKRAWETPADSSGTVQEAQTSDWWLKRKDFMGDLVSVALDKLQGGSDLNPAALAKALMAMLNGRHLQIVVDDSEASALLAARGWDGALVATPGQDFLAVIDSNVGFNKASAAIRNEINYWVTNTEGRLDASLLITYTHLASPLPANEVCDRTPRYGDSYNDMVRRCFWNYLRIYVPFGAELTAAEGIERVLVEPGEGDTTVIAGVFALRPGDTHVVRLAYRLPQAVEPLPYTLTIRKQGGAPPWPTYLSTGRCNWQGWLDTDHIFECPVGVE
jgi:hypothetical protein